MLVSMSPRTCSKISGFSGWPILALTACRTQLSSQTAPSHPYPRSLNGVFKYKIILDRINSEKPRYGGTGHTSHAGGESGDHPFWDGNRARRSPGPPCGKEAQARGVPKDGALFDVLLQTPASHTPSVLSLPPIPSFISQWRLVRNQWRMLVAAVSKPSLSMPSISAPKPLNAFFMSLVILNGNVIGIWFTAEQTTLSEDGDKKSCTFTGFWKQRREKTWKGELWRTENYLSWYIIAKWI